VNADVLVYGTARVGPDTTVVAPSFYISERLLEDAEELVGTHRLGEAVAVTGSLASSPAARIDLRKALAARARTLSDFVFGLSHFEQGEYATASRWFRQAEQASGGAAREVIYLFLGHAAGRSGALGEAQHFYARALALNPGYARAQFGMSEVRYQRSHRGCRPGRADESGLRAALLGFEQVEGRSQPQGAVLGVRALLGRARVLLCLSQAEIVARWDKARMLFLEVVEAFDRGERQLRDEASSALGSLGLIHLPGRGEREPEPMLVRAARYYQRALKLSLDASRKAVFSGMLGFTYGKLGRVEDAKRAYRRAARLDPSSEQRYERARRALQEP
jgi:tetratricopeptide (TPR) repeat protein